VTGLGVWQGIDSEINQRVRRQSAAALNAYAANPLLVREHVSIERATTQGGYGRRQIYELVQNGADALQGLRAGRISVVLTDHALYCANEGQAIDGDGVDAILSSHLNVKKANEIGRFGIGFKSVLAVTKVPEFYSRSGSFRFDRAAAQTRISAALGRELHETEVPVLRTAEPLEVAQVAEDDRTLRYLMEWATTVVKLPRLHGQADWLSEDLHRFPPEFLLFSSHVGRLTLENRVSGRDREITLARTREGLHLRADGRDELWRIESMKYVPSDFVKEDGGVHAERKDLPLSWAVQPRGRIGRGRFWAFFPTETITTLSGILNAPWKTNEDRQNLLPGPFNREFIEKAAELVVNHLPTLVTPREPARHLDLLPSRDSYNWADELLGETVFAMLADRPVVPDQDGAPRKGGELSLHPEGLSPRALELWADYEGRPRTWVHRDAETTNRRPRVERLVPTKNHRTHGEWLEALAADRTPAGSMAAVRVAAVVAGESKPSIVRQINAARIVLTDAGVLERADEVLFTVPGRPRSQRARYVAPALTSDSEVRAALVSLGVRESDPSTDIAAFLVRGIDKDDDEGWRTFWNLASRVPAARLSDIARGAAWDPRDLRLRTVAGVWERLRLTLLPGRVVPGDGSRDANTAVDLETHNDVLDHLTALGLTDGPKWSGGWGDEPWLDEYKAHARDAYIKSLAQRGRARPRADSVSVEELRTPFPLTGPLETLDRLSDEGRAAMTEIALEAGAGPERVWVSHETAPEKYKRGAFRGPVAWRLRRSGMLNSSLGIVPVANAVGPQLAELRELLPVAACGVDEAALLRLPANIAEVNERQWADAVAAANTCTDIQTLGALVVGLVSADIVPDQIRAQAGEEFVSLPPAEVTVLSEVGRASDLAAHAVPFIAVRTSADANLLVKRLGMKSLAESARFEVAATLIRDPAPLVDEFPPLQMYMDSKYEGLSLARCSELSERVITVQGTTELPRPFALTPSTAYWNESGGDVELLRTLRRELDLPITEEDCQNIATRQANRARTQRLRDLRKIKDPHARFAETVGPDRIRARLPEPVLEAIGQDDATDGRTLAIAASALMGPNLLKEFRQELSDAGLEPPTQWAGSAPARAFVRELGFPSEFAGTEHQRLDSLLSVDGPPELPDLHPYQETIAVAIHALLRRSGGRGLLSLPTGAGKTRIAVQALIEAMAERSVSTPILWMAETEELCEQAVQAWAYVWRARGSRDQLHISRLWSSNEAAPVQGTNHVIVATVAKLMHCVDDDEYGWLANPGCVVIDEAHGAIAPVYTKILAWLGLTHDQAPRPMIGLTATPYRGTSEEQTARLVNRFYGHRLDDGVLGDDQYETLQRMGVLAMVEHELLDGVDIELTPDELQRLQQTRLMPTSAGGRLALNQQRNDALMTSIRARPADETVLLFAASVEHAEILAAALSTDGIPAAAISSRTPAGARRYFIEEFRRGRIRVLTNYAVLTEGFDAPAVRAVYVARPTYSPNLYQQMIGRGLRGPMNGGKEKCLIVNVRDNIAQYGEALAFNQFEYLWNGRGE
jgi:superfamily II DNA or RNA helicase